MDPKKWKSNQWIGFFKYLDLNFDAKKKGWGYVPNYSGGFMGFWWNRKKNIDGHDLYLQIEGPKLCFKICTSEKEEVVDKNIKWKWVKRVREVATQMDLPIDKPKRLGNGKSVTFIEWRSDSDTCYQQKMDNLT